MDLDASVLWDFAGEVAGRIAGASPSVPATVTRVDADGTVWVTTGDGTEAPAATSSVGVSVGDTVSVQWSGARMGVTGNSTDPSAGERALGVVRRVASAAQDMAMDAQAIAAATGQFFWHDASGAHVSTEDRNAAGEQNTIWNSIGMLFRKGERVLLAIVTGDSPGMDVYDGLGNDADNIIASFRGGGARIGRTSDAHMELSGEGLDLFTQEGVASFGVHNTGGSHEETRYTVAQYLGASGTVLNLTTSTAEQSAGIVQSHVLSTTATLDRIMVGVRVSLYDASTGRPISTNRQAQQRVELTAGSAYYTSSFTMFSGDQQLTYRFRITYNANSNALTVMLYASHASTAYRHQVQGFVASVGYMETLTVLDPAIQFGAGLSDAAGSYSVALGQGVSTGTSNQTAVGRWNADDGESAFEVGNGTSDGDRSNALAVSWDGLITATPRSYEPTWASGETAAHYHCVVQAGICHLFYQGQSKAHSAGALLFTLPEECRPADQTLVPFVKNASAYGVVSIAADGGVTVNAISSTSATGRIYLDASWPTA